MKALANIIGWTLIAIGVFCAAPFYALAYAGMMLTDGVER